MDPDARFRSPVALRAARRDHTILDAVLLTALLVLAAIVLTSSSSTVGSTCDASYVQVFCSGPITSDVVRPS